MYLLILKRQNLFMQIHIKFIDLKVFNYLVEIDVLINSLQNITVSL